MGMDESYCGASHELQDDSLTGGTHKLQQPETSTAPEHQNKLVDELTRQNEQLRAELAAKDEQLQLILNQLAHVDKLAMMGTLGASVAHELNNPLTVISAEAEEIIDAIEGGHENQKLTVVSAKHIRQCADKMRYFVDHLRQYSRKDETTPWQKVDINTTIHDALLMLKPRLREANIRVQLSLAKTLPKIWGHHIKLESVFQNLIANAIDSFTPDCENRRRFVTISTTQEAKNGVVAQITDNGCGMSEEVRNKMFDPFFTTKKSDQGTGLGLAMVNTYLQDHHAELEVESQEDKGTVMTIRFPLERRSLLSGQSGSQQSRGERKKEHSHRR
ncbi:MAG: sensor histidine kinase [bacterium]